MAKKTLILWRDIPSQVVVQRGRRREKLMLATRFQQAIDRAAMRAGKGSSDAYIAEWRRETIALDGEIDIEAIVKEEANRIDREFPDERLDALIRSHGVDGGG